MSRISLSSLRRVSREDLQGAPDWVDPLLTASNEFQEQATAALERPLLTGVLDTYDFVHGVEQIIKSPLGVMPSGVSDVRCRGVTVDSAGKPTGAFYTLGVARLDWRPVQSRPGEPIRVGVTAYFAPPYGDISLERTTNLAITNATLTAVQFSSASVQTGGLSWTSGANTRLVCAHAGTIALTSRYAFDTAAAGYRQCYINRTGVTSYFAESLIPGGSYAGASGAEEITVASGDYLELIVAQTSGGNLNLIADRVRMAARYVAPTVGTRGRVTLRFDGGN